MKVMRSAPQGSEKAEAMDTKVMKPPNPNGAVKFKKKPKTYSIFSIDLPKDGFAGESRNFS